MKRFTSLLLLVSILLTISTSCQTTPPKSELSDPYKSMLDRLAVSTVQSLPGWRFHADVAHAEDTALDDSQWETMKVGDRWKTGPRVLRRWVEVPEKING